MADTVLSLRALNRTLLARQHLLARSPMSTAAMIDTLVGMQAQEPLSPYPSLWSRVEGFQAADLAVLLQTQQAARINVMRTTIHLLTSADAVRVRAVTQPVVAATWRASAFRKQLEAAGIEAADVVAHGDALFADGARTMPELRAALAERWPDADPTALTYAVRFLLPLTQLPPRGVWGAKGAVRQARLVDWAGAPMDEAADAAWLLERYLRAFGPATVADARSWSGLTGLGEAVQRLGDRLRVVRDEDGRELLDVADGTYADPAVPAPVRFLGEFDNAQLGHADRSRIIRPAVAPEIQPIDGRPVVLVGGFIRARWRFDADRTVVVEPVDDLTKRETAAVAAEGRRLTRWARTTTVDL